MKRESGPYTERSKVKTFKLALALFIAISACTFIAASARFLRYNTPEIPEYYWRFGGDPTITVGDVILARGTPTHAQYWKDNIDLWFGDMEIDVQPANFSPYSPVEYLNNEDPPYEDSPWLGFLSVR